MCGNGEECKSETCFSEASPLALETVASSVEGVWLQPWETSRVVNTEQNFLWLIIRSNICVFPWTGHCC